MKLYCPNCKTEFQSLDVNVADNLAYCRQCSEAFAISQLLGHASTRREPLPDPVTNIPKGCWYHETMDGWTAGATTRSAMAFFIVPFMCMWSGGSLGGIYGSQIIHGKFNLVMSLFGLPFLVGTIFIGGMAAMTIAGKVILTVSGNELTVFTGVWGIGWRRKVTIEPSSRLYSNRSNVHYPGSSPSNITIEGPKSIRFGSGLSFPRQIFLTQLLRYKFNLPDQGI